MPPLLVSGVAEALAEGEQGDVVLIANLLTEGRAAMTRFTAGEAVRPCPRRRPKVDV